MKKWIDKLCYRLLNILKARAAKHLSSRLGACGERAYIQYPYSCGSPERIFLADDAHLFEGFSFVSSSGRFYMGKGSTTGIGLSIITNSHKRVLGKFRVDDHEADFDQDIVVEEDVLFGAFVTLMDGCRIGRGATIGAGTIIRNNVPPYAIVVGNPAKVVGFSFTPEQIIEHEKALYPENERLPLELLEKNYKKYFLDRMKDIRTITSL